MHTDLGQFLERSSTRHDHLCPRQVLGVRIGLAGMRAMGWPGKVTRDLGLIIIETDGCFADGIEVSTGATVGHRTLRVNDLGKIAATFAAVGSGRALRFWPHEHVRDRACGFAPEETHRYLAQLQGYQRMPDGDLLRVQPVSLEPTVVAILSSPAARAVCSCCGEEVFNQREVVLEGVSICRHCSGAGYYAVDLTAERLRNVHCAQIP